MRATKDNATWISKVFTQDAGDPDWIKYQVKLDTIPPGLYVYPDSTTTTLKLPSDSVSQGDSIIVYNATDGYVEGTVGTVTESTCQATANIDNAGLSIDKTVTLSYFSWVGGVYMSSDGTKLYVAGTRASDNKYVLTQFHLSTPWDISVIGSTPDYVITLSFGPYGPFGITFSPDGTNLYIIDWNNNIYWYTLSTPWDISTATQKTFVTYNSAHGIYVSPDGTRVYVSDMGGYVKEYILSTPWDISSINPSSPNASLKVTDNAAGIRIDDSGKRMIYLDWDGRKIYQIDMTTPYSLSTASVTTQFDYGTAFSWSYIQDLYIIDCYTILVSRGKDDNTLATLKTSKPFVTTGYQEIDISSFGLTTPPEAAWKRASFSIYIAFESSEARCHYDNIDISSDIQNPTSSSFVYDTDQSDDFFKPGDRLIVNGEQVQISEVDTETINHDLKFLRNELTQSLSSITTAATSLFINGDGTKLFLTSGNQIYPFIFGVPFDITSLTAATGFDSSAQDEPLCVFLSSDGTKLYILGKNTKKVYQYVLTTAWNVTTASYTNINLDPTSDITSPVYIFFSSDGTKLYILESGTTSKLYVYSLSTPWSLLTTNLESATLTFDETVKSIYFTPDGTKLYICCTSGTSQLVKYYTLSTAWDISTATEVGSHSVDEDLVAFWVLPDGSKAVALYNEETTSDTSTTYTPTLILEDLYYYRFTVTVPSQATTISSVIVLPKYEEISLTRQGANGYIVPQQSNEIIKRGRAMRVKIVGSTSFTVNQVEVDLWQMG